MAIGAEVELLGAGHQVDQGLVVAGLADPGLGVLRGGAVDDHALGAAGDRAHQGGVDEDRLAATRGAGDQGDVGAIGGVEEVDPLQGVAGDRVADRHPAPRAGRGGEQRNAVGDVPRGEAASRAERVGAERQAADEAPLPQEAPAVEARVRGPLHLAGDRATLVVEQLHPLGGRALGVQDRDVVDTGSREAKLGVDLPRLALLLELLRADQLRLALLSLQPGPDPAPAKPVVAPRLGAVAGVDVDHQAPRRRRGHQVEQPVERGGVRRRGDVGDRLDLAGVGVGDVLGVGQVDRRAASDRGEQLAAVAAGLIDVGARQQARVALEELRRIGLGAGMEPAPEQRQVLATVELARPALEAAQVAQDVGGQARGLIGGLLVLSQREAECVPAAKAGQLDRPPAGGGRAPPPTSASSPR